MSDRSGDPVREEKTLERQIRAFHWVRLLAELPGRVAGSPLEREAAERVESWMREIGLEEVVRMP
ncbi:MAG TPA: aminopeptidase, partial [Myxococcota bacterium]